MAARGSQCGSSTKGPFSEIAGLVASTRPNASYLSGVGSPPACRGHRRRAGPASEELGFLVTGDGWPGYYSGGPLNCQPSESELASVNCAIEVNSNRTSAFLGKGG